MQAQVSYKLQTNITKIWSNPTCMNNRGDHITLKRPNQCPVGTRAYRQARNEVTHSPLFPPLTSAGRHPSSRRRIQQPWPPGQHPNNRWRKQQPRPPATPQTKRSQETWKSTAMTTSKTREDQDNAEQYLSLPAERANPTTGAKDTPRVEEVHQRQIGKPLLSSATRQDYSAGPRKPARNIPADSQSKNQRQERKP